MPSTVVLSVYAFEAAHGHVTAELIPPASVTEAHRRGVPDGRVSFLLPKGAAGLANHARELRTLGGELTFEGHTVQIGLKRGSDDALPPSRLPKARQIGRRSS